MDLPDDKKRRSTIVIGVGRRNTRAGCRSTDPMPVSDVNFIVPPRRPTSLAGIDIDGFKTEVVVTIKQDTSLSGADKEITALQWKQ